MRVKWFIFALILVVLPAAILSTLAARAIRHYELIMQAELEQDASRVLSAIDSAVRDKTQHALEMVRTAPDGDTSQGELRAARKLLFLEALIAAQPQADVEIQAIQVGPAVFLANPAEFFVKSGKAIKAACAFPFTYIVELANGCVGYTPPAEEFLAGGGGMETWLHDYRNLVPEAEAMIVRASLELGAELMPGRVPEYIRETDPYPPFATNPPELE